MKVRKVWISNFKQFVTRQAFDFVDETTGKAKPNIVLVGENGCGKSTLMQAIAIVMELATGRLKEVSELDWPGLDFAQAQSGRRPTRIELEVEFDLDEIQKTVEYFGEVKDYFPNPTAPSKGEIVRVVFDASAKNESRLELGHGHNVFQFRGREYALNIQDGKRKRNEYLRYVGTALHYHEQREFNSVSTFSQEKKNFSLDDLRNALGNLYGFSERINRGDPSLGGAYNIYGQFKQSYERVFSDRRLQGPLPSSGDDLTKGPKFLLDDGRNEYEIAEISGGERALLPILLDMANWYVSRSVVLIDEIELHLHPPLQQSFYSALPDLGEDNQFIISTHSDYVANLVPDKYLYRMDGETVNA